MKQLTCELCGGTDFAKQDGSFVCQSCGTKYSLEEARKIMSEASPTGTDEVKPSVVNVQNTAQVDNLFNLAKSSYDSKNYAQAENFCNQIIGIDNKNFEAWKLKGRAIHFQTTAGNDRGLEAFNCLKEAFALLDNEGQKAQKEEFAELIKAHAIDRISFWVNQVEAQRPTAATVEKAKAIYVEILGNIAEFWAKAIEQDNSEAGEIAKIINSTHKELKEYYILKMNTMCVSAWKSTVAYNYYRKSLDSNSRLKKYDNDYDYPSWEDDDFRPDNTTLSTFIQECDYLIELLDYVSTLFDEDADKETTKNIYENIIYFESHVLFARSYKRMVSTTTNGYGAVIKREEYWEVDKCLTDDAKRIRRKAIAEYKEKILSLDPERKRVLNETNKKIENLEKEKSALVYQRSGLVTMRTTTCFGLVCFVLFGIITSIACFISGIIVMADDEEIGLVLLGIAVVSLIIGIACKQIKTPSQEEYEANNAKYVMLGKKIDAIDKEMEELKDKIR